MENVTPEGPELVTRISKVMGFVGAEFRNCDHCGQHVWHVPLGTGRVQLDQHGAVHQVHEVGNRPALETRFEELYLLLGSRRKPCDHCPAEVFMIRTKKGSWLPMQQDGIPHWGKCPGANQARRPR